MRDYPEMALEPRDPPVVGICAVCGKNITAGMLARRDGEYLLHNEKYCLKEWAETNFSVFSVFDGMGMEAEIV